jgi:hypothetical protein
MEKNEGTVDRVVRTLVGLVLLSLGVLNMVPYKTVVLLIGLIAIVTGLTGFCAIYKLVGINTCRGQC